MAERSNPTFKEWWLHRRRRVDSSYSMFKVRRGSCEEIPLVQGKEQRLHFARAAMKRYPTSKICVYIYIHIYIYIYIYIHKYKYIFAV